MAKNLAGLYVALLTPFEVSGKINEESLRSCVEMNIAKGVDGFYVGGSTGECFLMTPNERKSVLEIVGEQTNGRVNIICHSGAIGTDATIQIASHAIAHGADAISSIPPFYYKYSKEEIVQYYRDIASAVKVPVIPYNFPALSGVTLDLEIMRRLWDIPNIVGIKHTSLDLYYLQQMKRNLPELIIFNGHDEVYLAGLSMGADGAIGSTLNFMAEKFIAVREAFRVNDMLLAASIQTQINDVISMLLETGKFLACAKFLLDLKGIPFGVCRKPFSPLNDEDKKICEFISQEYLV